ncbi:septation ring formation regulator EzrA [Lactobacillus mulieris]|uniref:septation ring formation regulator EzrA n=1 Tax=Lactobacillus mulieris TaxID=2508708 RepID=UPI001F33EDAC|nr:septation ring formation regulator EzrA [Lactobacillus mulieris]MCF1783205.1 septation ring formation regulator EzrA [Lactobacillus mulieris]MCW8103954.1 septation ring formation regulator EzrA [Lactobacillus mulieris]
MSSIQSLIIISIVVLLIAATGSMLMLNRRQSKILSFFEQDLNDLEDLGISADIKNLAQMELAGESLKTFNSWKKVYEKANDKIIPDLHERIEQCQEINTHYNLLRARKEIKAIDSAIDSVSEDLNKTKEVFRQLLESNRANKLQYDSLIKIYRDIRKEVLAASFYYGPALEKIEDELSELERHFNNAKNLSAQGDYVEGKRVLEKIDKRLAHLKDLLPRIKKAQNAIQDVYPEQLDELTNAYRKMRVDKLAVSEIDFLEEVKKLQTLLEKSRDLEARLEIDELESNNAQLAKKIDGLYDVITKEYSARPFVEQNQDKILRLLSHLENGSNQLIDKLEHIDQSYELTHGELQEAKDLSKEVSKMEEKYNQDVQALADGKGVYSEIKERWLKQLERISKIEKREKELVDEVDGLYEAEKMANESISGFKQDVALIYRRLQRRNLPGKPDSFIQMYTLVVNEISHTSQELNQVRINMEKISEEMIQISDDVDRLKKEADQIINYAALVELTVQYSNKYRTNPKVAKARRTTMDLYSRAYNYKDALDTIATAMEQVEPGSYQRIESAYYSQLSASDDEQDD